jgi:hypothetical protein
MERGPCNCETKTDGRVVVLSDSALRQKFLGEERHIVMKSTETNATDHEPTSIALLAALAIGEFSTTLVIVFFVLIAEVLEGLTVGRARRAIKELLDLLPRTALLRSEGKEHVDGNVVRGHFFIDQSSSELVFVLNSPRLIPGKSLSR